MTPLKEHRARWLNFLLSTERADRSRAEAGLRAFYVAAGFTAPAHMLWYDSPCAASWALATLVPNSDRVSSRLIAPDVLTKEERDRLERARMELRDGIGVGSWNEVPAAIGSSRSSVAQIRMDPRQTFMSALLAARFAMVDDVSALFAVPQQDDELARAEAHFWGSNRGVLHSALACPTTHFLIRRSFYDQHPLSTLANDVNRAGGSGVPPIMHAASEVAQSAGLWWPYVNAVLLSDRPAQIHCNELRVPHREDDPAVVFRDGWRVYAWNGKAVPERWITETASVAAGEYRGFDPTFLAWAKSRRGSGRAVKKTRQKSACFFRSHSPRSTALESTACARTPAARCRYLGGAHREVWSELVALGPSVREEAHAADALAVAYETMHRVERNVRTLIDRLSAMGYVFAQPASSSPRPHIPPGPGA